MADYRYHRCKTCGNLLTDRLIKKGICTGHKVQPAIKASFVEWSLVKLGLFEWWMLFNERRHK